MSNSQAPGTSIGITPSMQSYARPQLEGHNMPVLSSRGQSVDTSVISRAVNQAKRSRLGGINHY